MKIKDLTKKESLELFQAVGEMVDVEKVRKFLKDNIANVKNCPKETMKYWGTPDYKLVDVLIEALKKGELGR